MVFTTIIVLLNGCDYKNTEYSKPVRKIVYNFNLEEATANGDIAKIITYHFSTISKFGKPEADKLLQIEIDEFDSNFQIKKWIYNKDSILLNYIIFNKISGDSSMEVDYFDSNNLLQEKIIIKYNDKKIIEKRYYHSNGELSRFQKYDLRSSGNGYYYEIENFGKNGIIQFYEKYYYNEEGRNTAKMEKGVPTEEEKYLGRGRIYVDIYSKEYDTYGNLIKLQLGYPSYKVSEFKYEYDTDGNWILKQLLNQSKEVFEIEKRKIYRR